MDDEVDQFADLISAVLEAYDPEGVVIWLRSWVNHPEMRRRAEAGVLHCWSGQPPDPT